MNFKICRCGPRFSVAVSGISPRRFALYLLAARLTAALLITSSLAFAGDRDAALRLPVPTERAIQLAQQRLRSGFAELVEIVPTAEPEAWVKILLDQNQWQDDASHYAALFEAASVAAESGDMANALMALRRIATRFNVESGVLGKQLIQAADSRQQLNHDQATAWLDQADAWMLEQKFSDSQMVAAAVQAATSLAANGPARRRAQSLSAESTLYTQWFDSRPAAPPATDAQRMVEGKCLAVLGQWDAAIPLLVDATEINLRKAATADAAVTAGKSSPAAACQAWLRVVAVEGDARVWQRRAVHWFELAGNNGRTTAVVNLEKRMKQLGLFDAEDTSSVPANTTAAAVPLTLRQTHLAHSGIVSSVSFARSGDLFCSAGEDGAIKVWKIGEREPTQVLTGHVGEVFAATLSHDGKVIASGGRDKRFRLWKVANGQVTDFPPTHTVSIRDIAFVGNSKWAASASDDRRVVLWSAAGLTPIVVQAHQGIVYTVDVSPRGQWVASGSEDRQVHVFRPSNTPQVIPLLGHQAPVHSVAFSHDEKRLFSGDANGKLIAWDLDKGTSQSHDAHLGIITGISVAAGGKWMATCSKDASIHLWNVADLTKQQSIGPLTHEVRGVALSPDGNRLVAAMKDGRVLVYGRE